MEQLQKTKMVLWGSIGIFIVVLTMLILCPILNSLLFVAPVEQARMPEKEIVQVKPAEELLVTAIYQKEADGKIEAIYVEVFHTDTGNAYYMHVPVHTKVTLSDELYPQLQAYSPELPQYFKLKNMGEGFSEEYRMTGCNRILSEVLGVEITHYITANEESMESFWDSLQTLMKAEEAPKEFFLSYAKWLEFSEADLTAEDRWVYYESYKDIILHETVTAPGAEGPTEYLLSTAQTKARLQEMLQARGN